MLSTTAEYALRIMVVLAQAQGEARTSERIAGQTEVPPDYSVKVLQMLARGGLVRAQRGRGGGFRLDCDPALTTLLDVVNAIDPITRIETCPLGRGSNGHGLCALHSYLDAAIAAMQEGLSSRSLADVVEVPDGRALCEPAVTPVVTPGKIAPTVGPPAA